MRCCQAPPSPPASATTRRIHVVKGRHEWVHNTPAHTNEHIQHTHTHMVLVTLALNDLIKLLSIASRGAKLLRKLCKRHSIKGAYELCGKLVSESDYTRGWNGWGRMVALVVSGLLQCASSDLSRQSLLPSQSQLRGMHCSTVRHLNSLLGQAFTKHNHRIETVVG